MLFFFTLQQHCSFNYVESGSCMGRIAAVMCKWCPGMLNFHCKECKHKIWTYYICVRIPESLSHKWCQTNSFQMTCYLALVRHCLVCRYLVVLRRQDSFEGHQNIFGWFKQMQKIKLHYLYIQHKWINIPCWHFHRFIDS